MLNIGEKMNYSIFATNAEKNSFYDFLKRIREDATEKKFEYSQFYMEYTYVTPYGVFHYSEDDDNGIPSSIERVA